MSGRPFRVVALDATVDRTSFKSRSEPLNRYFREQVSQDIRRLVAACFVAIDDVGRIAGYYTLSMASVLLNELPISAGKKLPRYPTVPAARMGRLAVDEAYAGQGLGGALLGDALARVARADIAAFALLVDAKDETAVSFYKHHGFVPLNSSSAKLFLPIATIAALKF